MSENTSFEAAVKKNAITETVHSIGMCDASASSLRGPFCSCRQSRAATRLDPARQGPCAYSTAPRELPPSRPTIECSVTVIQTIELQNESGPTMQSNGS